MDLHLDILLNLPNVTVFSCYQKEGLTILQLEVRESQTRRSRPHFAPRQA